MNYPAGILRAKAMADAKSPGSFMAKAAPDKVGELYIYDAIGQGMFGGGISSQMVADAMAGMKGAKELRVFINSPGGYVFDGVSIFNQIARFPGRKVVTVDGIAASAASVIAMAGDEIRVAQGGMMMVHNAWGMAVGNAATMRETADLLDKVSDTAVLGAYARTKQTPEKLKAMMDAETWMDGSEAVALGFADTVLEAAPVASASWAPALAAYDRTPKALLDNRPARNAAAVRSAVMGERLAKLRREFPAPGAASAPPNAVSAVSATPAVKE